jgi:hypothetical protein
MHYLSLVWFAVIVTFLVRSERDSWQKVVVGLVAIASASLQFFSPYSLAGAIASGVVGIAVVMLQATER